MVSLLMLRKCGLLWLLAPFVLRFPTAHYFVACHMPSHLGFKPRIFLKLAWEWTVEHRLGCDSVVQYGFMIHSFSQSWFLQSGSWVGVLSPARVHGAEWKEYECLTGARLGLGQSLSIRWSWNTLAGWWGRCSAVLQIPGIPYRGRRVGFFYTFTHRVVSYFRDKQLQHQVTNRA